MIRATVRVGGGNAGFERVISASSIREAVTIAHAHPGEDIRVAYPIDPERFFPKQQPRPGVLQEAPVEVQSRG